MCACGERGKERKEERRERWRAVTNQLAVHGHPEQHPNTKKARGSGFEHHFANTTGEPLWSSNEPAKFQSTTTTILGERTPSKSRTGCIDSALFPVPPVATMAIKRESHLMPDGPRRAGNVDDESRAVLDAIQRAQGPIASVQVLASILLRLFIFVFLRWIPSQLVVWPTHVLYGVYLITWTSRQRKVRTALTHAIETLQLMAAKDDLQDLGEQAAAASVSDKGIEASKSTQSGGIESKIVENRSVNGTRSIHQATDAQSLSSVSPGALLKALMFGQSTRSTTLNRIIFAGHTIIFLFFLDSIWSPLLYPSHYEHTLQFARVGALSPKSATVHVRYPYPLGHEEDYYDALLEEDSDVGSVGGALKDMQALLASPQPIRIVYREVYSTAIASAIQNGGESVDSRPRTNRKRWERGPLLTLTADSDWTAAAKIENLWPATEYEWRLAFAHNSTFTPIPSRARKFTTWPDPRLSGEKGAVGVGRGRNGLAVERPVPPLDDPNHFTFASSSCVKPDFPYAPTQFWAWSWLLRLVGIGVGPGGSARRNRIPGFDQLADATIDGRDSPALRFFLQLGDLIYADVPYYAGPHILTYRKLYRNLFASESFRRVYERLPVIGIYDDHEVINNWGGRKIVSGADEDEDVNVSTKEIEALRPASQVWEEYIGSSNPDPLVPGETYHTFRYGDVAFFVMDVRKFRSPYQLPDDEDKTMLGAAQRDAFVRWLGAVNSTATFKFVASSVPFNTLWGGPLDQDGKKDTWAAYTTEREYLLEIMQVSLSSKQCRQ